MKRVITMASALMMVVAVSAEPILWDLNSNRAQDRDATVQDFRDAGVTEWLPNSANVSIVLGQASGSMTNDGVTLTFTGVTASGSYAYDPVLPEAPGSNITRDYVYMSYGGPCDLQVGGLSSKLAANTTYGFYLWGYGDGADQNSTFIYGGVTNTIAQVADPKAADADQMMVKYSFTTGAVVDDTLDFTWSRTGGQRFAAINGFAMVPEPATFGLVAVFGGVVIFIRRNFKI